MQNKTFFNKKRIIFLTISFIILIAAIIITIIDVLNIDFVLIFKDIFKQLSTNNISIIFLLILILFPVFRIFQVGFIYYYDLNKHNINVKLTECLKLAIIYLFIISITPSSIGGEPYLVYWLTKHNIKLNEANAKVLVISTLGHLSGIIVTWPSYIYFLCNIDFNEQNAFVISFSTIGMFMDIVVLGSFAIATFSTKIHYWFAVCFNKILKLLKLKYKSKDVLNLEYNKKKEFKNLIKKEYRKINFVLIIFLSGLVFNFYLYFAMYFSFGIVSDFNNIMFHEIFNYSNIAVTANNFIPLPGSEGSLQILLKQMFSLTQSQIETTSINQSIFVWRFFTTNIQNIIGLFVIFSMSIKFFKEKYNLRYNKDFMNKKSVLIITNKPHNTIGGIENYNKLLIQNFIENNIDVYELNLVNKDYLDAEQYVCNSLLKTKIKFDDKKYEKWFKKTQNFNKISGNNISSLFYLKSYIINSRKIVRHFLKNNSFGLIIDSTYFSFDFLANKEEFVWVQHNSKKSLQGKIFNNPIMNFFGFLSIKFLCCVNTFKKTKNVVLFDEQNEKDVNIPNKFFYKIPLPYTNDFVKHHSYRHKIVFIGRIEKYQKRCDLLVETAKYLNFSIDVYGSGNYLEHIINAKNINYKGKFNNKDISSILKDAKYIILLSDHEGFPFVCVEALSNGVGLIIRNTFPSASFFIGKNNQRGLLIDPKLNAISIAKQINKFVDENVNNYVLHDQCYQFALNNFTNETFFNNWFFIYNELLVKKN